MKVKHFVEWETHNGKKIAISVFDISMYSETSFNNKIVTSITMEAGANYMVKESYEEVKKVINDFYRMQFAQEQASSKKD